ncbi:MAG TPA: NBR1-Ig-like domain-containing protein, partial [Clostridia bacterium]|nr:NBR1-Ig-like domain-containing protein [Clostridia bacterium]
VPTWDYYSYEIVSDDIPPVMPPGSTTTVHVTMRNRGVLWNDARQFRLGAVGDSDPFTTTTRYNVGAEIGPGSTRTFTITLRAPTTLGTYNTDWRMLREGVTWFGPTLARTILVSTNGDQVAPATPTGLVATATTYSQVNLKWNPASDNVWVTGYRVYRNAVLLGTTSTTNYSDNNLASKTTYTYQVAALDGSGNASSLSAPVQVTTPPQLDFILDNSQGAAVGTWTIGTSSADKYLADYHWLTTSTSVSGTFTWAPSIEQPGFYSVFAWYPQGANRCTNSLFTIQYAGGAAGVRINQTTGGGQWVSLGVNRPFVTGTTGKVQLNNLSVEPAKVVIADAVRFTYASPLPTLASPQIITVAGTARLTWNNPYCVLQENASLDPMSWTDIPGAKSPYQVSTTTGPRRFYRLRY